MVWPSCAVWPDTDGGGWSAALPYGSGLSRGEVVECRGRLWLATSTAASYLSPFTGWQAGDVVTLSPVLARVRIERASDWLNPATRRTERTFGLVWQGPAFVPLEDQASPTLGVGVEVRTDRTLLLPSDAVAVGDDRVSVTEAADPLLAGAVWWVSLVHTGPWPSERRVTVREVR